MAVFIGGIGSTNNFSNTKIVVINDVPEYDKRRADTPYRNYRLNKNDKEWFIYTSKNGSWELRTTIFGSSYINAAQFIMDAHWLKEGKYLINSGDKARTSYLFNYDGSRFDDYIWK